ncbi:winged helix-turn-helix domain-containing protein [Tropicibacter oceani]|uniref:Crosslink repair DNA glycosylase YcaQ family protein n=1 Tax=Tropicibacter oceani TaxID=3058420 RepID=A0ABY8QLH8_9RHOB|nr:crosslink repair DNA glycosylase YcaQ family protein [Tropicibacter oceani]WGW04853.1 crosslink repair DNA glycosylase YcaQ family protein [Tropicibacter oceani]
MRLENALARRLFLHKHALSEAPTGPSKGADLLELIQRIGFVQVDSVRTVERAHHMILFARRASYRPAHLDPVLEPGKGLFEHWTHDASVIPTDFYPHWQLRFARDRDRMRTRWEKWQRNGFAEKFDEVLGHIRDNGACGSADVGGDEERSSGGWWDWHPSKTALEYLWRTGVLSVVRRDSFRKIYDLTERVIAADLLQHRPDEAETVDWLCRQALDRLGFGTPGEIAAFWDTLRPAEVKAWSDAALTQGEIVPIEVQGADGTWRKCMSFPDVREQALAAPDPTGRLRVLSPFDPALRDRKRAERLFGFHYRIEIFVPAPKRIYGYYVFPLLEGDRLVGRIDMTAHRGDGVLDITALWPEHGVQWGAGRQARLEAELARMARFTGLEGLRWADGWLRAPR